MTSVAISSAVIADLREDAGGVLERVRRSARPVVIHQRAVLQRSW